jgi:hypothetical protein
MSESGAAVRRFFHPIGERPRGIARAAGFILLGILHYVVVSLGVTLVIGFALLGVLERVSRLSWAVVPGVIWLIAYSVLLAFLLLADTTHFPRLRWATWWVLLVDAVLRLLSGAVALAGAPTGLYLYGLYSTGVYDFRADAWSWALCSVIVASCTIGVLMWFTRRDEQGPGRVSADSMGATSAS